MSRTFYHNKWSNYLWHASSGNQWIVTISFKKIATLDIKFSYLPKDQILALGKSLRILLMPLMRAQANLKSLIWENISFPERCCEQIQISCITLWNKNLCLLLSLFVCACMYAGTFSSVKYNIFSVQKAGILNSEGNCLSNQLSSHLTSDNFLSVLAEKSATVYCLFYAKL